MTKLYVVVEFDMEEADADQAVRAIYGPFDNDVEAETWASDRFAEMGDEFGEYTALEVESICPIADWNKLHDD